MSLPRGLSSFEGIAKTTESMKKLQSKMERLFPGELTALLAEHPEVKSLRWMQLSEAGFMLCPLNIESEKKRSRDDLQKELAPLLDPMPSSSLLRLFSHNSTVIFTSSGFTRAPDPDGGGQGGARNTPGTSAFPSSPLGDCFKEYYELRDQAVAALPEALLAYAKEHEETFNGLNWAQYTPGFMDGDVCEFGVHGIGFLFKGGKSFISGYSAPKKHKKRCEEFEELLEAVHPDILYALYGDHVGITIIRGKIEVEEYTDHE